MSPGIEPWAANVFTEQSAKGTFIRKNPTLKKILRKHKLDNEIIWNRILKDGGSIQGIKALDKITIGEHDVPIKEVYKTFKESVIDILIITRRFRFSYIIRIYTS